MEIRFILQPPFRKEECMLETERLTFRTWTPGDAEELYRLAKDPEVGPIAGWPPHTSVENSRDVIKNVLAVPETYAIILKETGLPVGAISLKLGDATDMTDAEDECELGYWLGVPYWGKGLMTEAGKAILRHAFLDLGMQAVWCGYYDGNQRSKRVQEKLGFRYHHTTQNVPVPLLGETRTGHANYLTREDWLKQSGSAEDHK